MKEKFEITEIEQQNAPWVSLLRNYNAACENGNLEEIKSIIQEEIWEKFNFKNNWLNSGFIIGCKKGDLKLVQFFLTSKNLAVDYDLDTGFLQAVRINSTEIVNYLLTSPDLTKHSNIHTNNDRALTESCERGKLKMVKYLTSSPELEEHIKIKHPKYSGFKEAIRKNHNDILEYMIFDLNLVNTEEIKDYLLCYPNLNVEKMFTVRDSYRLLNSILKSDKEYPDKNKKI